MTYRVRQKIGLQLLSPYLLFVISVLLGSLGLYVYQQNVLTQNALQSDLGLAQAVALEVGTNLRAATKIDRELWTSQAAKDLDLKQLASVFANASNAHPDINLYFVCDPSGNMIINYPFSPSAIGKNFRSRDYFQGALKSDAPFISSGSISEITDSYVVSMAARIMNNQGQLVGVMGINLSLDQLTSRLNTVHQRLSPNSEVGLWVIDHVGNTIATTKGIFAFLNLPEDYDGLILASHDALQGRAGNFITHAQTRDWLYSYVPIPEIGWAVVVQRPTDITFAVLTNFQHGLMAALALLIVGATFFWFMMHRRVISPLTRLAKAVAQIQPDHSVQEMLSTMFDRSESYHEVVEPISKGRGPRIIEFQIRGSYKTHSQFVPALRDIRMRLFHVRDAKGVLIGRGRIFQDITKQNEVERIKRNLLAIVSHELRTPLSAIKGFATSLLEEVGGEVDTNWQEYSLRQIVAENNRMADLVSNPLEMAQVEAGTLKLSPGTYHLSSLLEDALASVHNESNRLHIC